MHNNRRHAQRIRHRTGVLPARTAKTCQRIARHIISALHRDFLDRIRHIFNGNRKKPFGHLLGRAAVTNFLGQLRERGLNCFYV